jgi:hypothetical protein
MSEKGFVKDKGRNALIASDDVHNVGVRPRNRDKVHICIVLLLFLLVFFFIDI